MAFHNNHIFNTISHSLSSIACKLLQYVDCQRTQHLSHGSQSGVIEQETQRISWSVINTRALIMTHVAPIADGQLMEIKIIYFTSTALSYLNISLVIPIKSLGGICDISLSSGIIIWLANPYNFMHIVHLLLDIQRSKAKLYPTQQLAFCLNLIPAAETKPSLLCSAINVGYISIYIADLWASPTISSCTLR